MALNGDAHQMEEWNELWQQPGSPSLSKTASVKLGKPTNSYHCNSLAMATAVGRSELRNQRQLNDESPRLEVASNFHSDDFIIPSVQLPKQSDEIEEDWACTGDHVLPSDSYTGRARLGKRGDEANICEREMVELRRLVQSDDRFGFALERAAQAVHECITAENASPILALLASLVWRSLCIAWELEPQWKLAKSHLRSKIVGLEGEQQHMSESFEEARTRYLKELVVLRDQVRRRDAHTLAAIHNVVFDTEPVIFYEPVKYLSEQLQMHVAEIVEEKLKQLSAAMHDVPYTAPEKKPEVKKKEEEEEDDEQNAPAGGRMTKRELIAKEAEIAAKRAARDAEESVEQMRKQFQESERKTKDLEKTVELLQAECGAVEADLCTMISAAQVECEDISVVLQDHGGIKLRPPPEVERTYSMSNAGSSLGDTLKPDVSVSGSVQDAVSMEDSAQSFQVGRQTSDAAPSFQAGEGRKPLRERSETAPTLSYQGGLGRERSFSSGAKCRSEYMVEMIGAEKHARKALLARLEEAEQGLLQASEASKAMVNQTTSQSASSSQVTKVLTARLEEAGQREQELRDAVSKQETASKEAEGRAKAGQTEIAKLQAELKRTQYSLEEETQARSAVEGELENAQLKIKELSNEVEQLRMLIDEISGDEGESKKKLKSVGLVWRLPTGQVFDRLFQDAVDRHERRKNMISSLEQARDEHALEIFQGSTRPLANSDLSGFQNQSHTMEDITSFGPIKSHESGWLTDLNQPRLQSLHAVMKHEGAQPHALVSSAVSSVIGASFHAARSPSPMPANGIPRSPSRHRSSSPPRQDYLDPDLEVEGTHLGRRSRSNSHEETMLKARGASGFAASLGLASTSELQTSMAEPWRRPLRPHSPKSASSRPTSANSGRALHKARATITARPRSAALPAIQRMQRPPSETSLNKEAQRLLAAPVNPTAQLTRTASAPSVRGSGAGAAHARPRRPQSGAHGFG